MSDRTAHEEERPLEREPRRHQPAGEAGWSPAADPEEARGEWPVGGAEEEGECAAGGGQQHEAEAGDADRAEGERQQHRERVDRLVWLVVRRRLDRWRRAPERRSLETQRQERRLFRTLDDRNDAFTLWIRLGQQPAGYALQRVKWNGSDDGTPWPARGGAGRA
eukprot:1687028-Prymnesium_polylepis.1